MENWQSFSSDSDWFSIQYPRMWDYEIVEDIPSFFDPYFGSGGVLQFFVAQMGKILSEDLLEKVPYLEHAELEDKMVHFLELQHVQSLPNLQPFQAANYEAIAAEYHIESRFYTAIMFQTTNKFLLALYNSPGEPSPEEAEIVSKIIKTVKITWRVDQLNNYVTAFVLRTMLFLQLSSLLLVFGQLVEYHFFLSK